MTASRVLVSLRVAASPDRAFASFSNDIGAWWRPNALFHFTKHSPGMMRFEPGPAGRLVETYTDGSVFEIGRVTVWEPPHRLSFTWRQAAFEPGQVTHVEVRFEEITSGETRITVEHRGWETVPQENASRHGFPDAIYLRRHAEWWQVQLTSLRRWSEAA